MTTESHSNNAVKRPRKPYVAPQILSREPLEVMAGVCAPAPPAKGLPGLCNAGPISS